MRGRGHSTESWEAELTWEINKIFLLLYLIGSLLYSMPIMVWDFKHFFTVENLLGDWGLQPTECYI